MKTLLSYFFIVSCLAAFSVTVKAQSCSGTATLNVTISTCVTTTTVKAKVFLKGAYNNATGLMSTALSTVSPLMPLNQPYNVAPWNYTGTESLSSIPSTMTDWVLVEIRSASSPSSAPIERKAAVLLNNGNIQDIDGTLGVKFSNLTSGTAYYIVVRHRNHVAVMSASTVTLPNATAYDFTVANSAYGANQISDTDGAGAGTVYGLFPGDINASGIISVADFNVYSQQPSATNQYNPRDLNLDRNVTVGDFNLYQANPSIIGISYIRY